MKMAIPSPLHTLIESRTLLEFAASTLTLPLLLKAPSGAHPVMVFPGFLASDASTIALRKFLSLKGYRTYGWKQGRNLGQHIELQQQVIRTDLLERVLAVYEQEKQPVHIIGWSLGGILAREVARLMPEVVDSVITLGSPFNSPEESSPLASTLFKKLNAKRMGGNFTIPDNLSEPPPVPCTSIFSRSDGIAHWQGCEQKGAHSHTENIEVAASHLGLGHHPTALWIIAHRLSHSAKYPGENWRPLEQHTLSHWLVNPAKS